MKTISGGFSSKTDGASLAAEALNMKLQTVSIGEMDDKEQRVIDDLKKGLSPSQINSQTGYGLAYTTAVWIRHKGEVKAFQDQQAEEKKKAEENAVDAGEEMRIRLRVSAGELPLSALEPYEKKEEAERITQDELPLVPEDSDKKDILDKVKEVVNNLTK